MRHNMINIIQQISLKNDAFNITLRGSLEWNLQSLDYSAVRGAVHLSPPFLMSWPLKFESKGD